MTTTTAPRPTRRRFDVDLTTKRVKRADLMNLSRQLGAFLRAGIPVLDAIAVLGEESDRPAVRRVMSSVAADLRSGSTFSEAVDRLPKDFPDFYRGILRSAELTGRLDSVLDQLSGYLERDLEARRKVKGALTYPAVVAVLAVVTVLILTLGVLPRFEAFFAELDTPLPLSTRLMLGWSRFVQAQWLPLATVLVGLAGLLWLGLKTEPGRRARDRVLLRTPVLGVTIRFAVVERFTRLLGSMVRAGVPLPEAMAVATGSLRNLVYERALGTARRQLIDGAGLAGPVAATGLFPGVIGQMLRVGEETGTLDTQLEVAAVFYERELDYKIKKLTTLVEPLVVIVMGGIVGFVAVALIQAMYGGLQGLGTA